DFQYVETTGAHNLRNDFGSLIQVGSSSEQKPYKVYAGHAAGGAVNRAPDVFVEHEIHLCCGVPGFQTIGIDVCAGFQKPPRNALAGAGDLGVVSTKPAATEIKQRRPFPSASANVSQLRIRFKQRNGGIRVGYRTGRMYGPENCDAI